MLIRARYSSLCGSDIPYFSSSPRFGGHEVALEVQHFSGDVSSKCLIWPTSCVLATGVKPQGHRRWVWQHLAPILRVRVRTSARLYYRLSGDWCMVSWHIDLVKSSGCVTPWNFSRRAVLLCESTSAGPRAVLGSAFCLLFPSPESLWYPKP